MVFHQSPVLSRVLLNSLASLNDFCSSIISTTEWDDDKWHRYLSLLASCYVLGGDASVLRVGGRMFDRREEVEGTVVEYKPDNKDVNFVRDGESKIEKALLSDCVPVPEVPHSIDPYFSLSLSPLSRFQVYSDFLSSLVCLQALPPSSVLTEFGTNDSVLAALLRYIPLDIPPMTGSVNRQATASSTFAAQLRASALRLLSALTNEAAVVNKLIHQPEHLASLVSHAVMNPDWIDFSNVLSREEELASFQAEVIRRSTTESDGQVQIILSDC